MAAITFTYEIPKDKWECEKLVNINPKNRLNKNICCREENEPVATFREPVAGSMWSYLQNPEQKE